MMQKTDERSDTSAGWAHRIGTELLPHMLPAVQQRAFIFLGALPQQLRNRAYEPHGEAKIVLRELIHQRLDAHQFPKLSLPRGRGP